MDEAYKVIAHALWKNYGYSLPDAPGMMAVKVENELKNKGFLKEKDES